MKKKWEAQEKYDKVNSVHVSLKLNKKTDSDILEVLEKEGNKQAYIKTAIREKIKTK